MGRQLKLLLSQKTCQGHLFIAKLSGERQAGYYTYIPFWHLPKQLSMNLFFITQQRIKQYVYQATGIPNNEANYL
jgi:hypothetical protein